MSQQLTTLPILERLIHYTNEYEVLKEFVASSKSIYNEATKRIDYRVMKYKYSLKIAIKCNDLPVIRWLNKNGYNKGDFWLIDEAAKYGHLELIQFFHKNGVGCTTYATNYAARNGHLEVIKWLHENRKEGFTEKAINMAAENGHIEVVKWLSENRSEAYNRIYGLSCF
jgi:hypothetical protein